MPKKAVAVAKPQTKPKTDEKDEQIKKLSQHIGQIEGKVQEITKKYEELKKKDKMQPPKPSSQPHPSQMMSEGKPSKNQSKIDNFAKMLKTLNGYKQAYEKAATEDEKTAVHDKVAEFTAKWLDTKNLQLSASISKK